MASLAEMLLAGSLARDLEASGPAGHAQGASEGIFLPPDWINNNDKYMANKPHSVSSTQIGTK